LDSNNRKQTSECIREEFREGRERDMQREETGKLLNERNGPPKGRKNHQGAFLGS